MPALLQGPIKVSPGIQGICQWNIYLNTNSTKCEYIFIIKIYLGDLIFSSINVSLIPYDRQIALNTNFHGHPCKIMSQYYNQKSISYQKHS